MDGWFNETHSFSLPLYLQLESDLVKKDDINNTNMFTFSLALKFADMYLFVVIEPLAMGNTQQVTKEVLCPSKKPHMRSRSCKRFIHEDEKLFSNASLKEVVPAKCVMIHGQVPVLRKMGGD